MIHNCKNLFNNKKITIITICYNAIETIEKTIQSVINQTYPNIEYIIIDGASTDGTVDIIKKYVSHITKFVSEPDKGIYDAMNKGIAMSTGDWINFMNAGDTFVNNDTIEKVFSNLNVSDAKVIYGNTYMVYPNFGIVKRYYGNYKDEDIPFNICHQSAFIDGPLLREIKYDLSFKIAADVNGFYSIYKLGHSFHFVDEYIANFETFCGVSSTSTYKLADEFRRIRGINKFSIYWAKSLIKTFIKNIRIKLIPIQQSEQVEYNRIKKKFEK